jgi:AraC family transcriptional regulator
MRKILVSDYNEDNFNSENMLPDVTPPTSKVIFDNIRVDDYRLPSQLLEGIPCHNSIIISKTFVPSVCRELGGDRKEEPFNIGHSVISPAKISHSACWDGEASFTVITLGTNLFERIAYEDINPDRAELLPRSSQYDPLFCAIGQIFSSKMQSQQPISRMYSDQMAITASVHLLENYCSTRYQLSESDYGLSSTELQQIFDYIEANLHRRVGLAELANLLGMSQYYFTRLFKNSTNVCPAQYSIERRLKKAIYLLENTKLNIATIAERTGFSPSKPLYFYFWQVFSDNSCSISQNKVL